MDYFIDTLGPFSEKILLSWDKSSKISDMEPFEMIRICLDNLKGCLEEEGGKMVPEEISIAFVGKNLPFSLLNEESVSGALNDGDYSKIRSHFKHSISSSLN